MVIVDTDVLAKALAKDNEHFEEISSLLKFKGAAITPAQIAEVYTLTSTDETPVVQQFLNLFQIWEFTAEVGKLAGEFLQQYQTYYPDLTILDCLVGATATINDAEIYTMAPKHFPMTEVRLYHKTIKAITAKSKSRMADND